MSKIKLQDSMPDILVKMAEGNPGALTVCIQLFKETDIDPQCLLGPVAHILNLDTLGIYGSRIWMLYKDVCHQNLVLMVAVLRAWQLGFLSEKNLNYAIDNQGIGLTFDDILALYAKVKERLPEFALFVDRGEKSE